MARPKLTCRRIPDSFTPDDQYLELNPKVFAVIPARKGSTRLPRKNLYPVRGIPLIAYTIHASLSAQCLDRVAVSTDDRDAMEVARSWGAEVIERPAELCQDTSPIDEALRHALQVLEHAMNAQPEILIWLQADVPIRKPGSIDQAVEMLRADCQASAVATGYKVSQHPAWMKTIDADGYLSSLDPRVTQYRAQDLPELFLLDGAIVAMRPENLETYREPAGLHRYLGKRPKLLLQEHPMYSLNVETSWHAELAEFYLERYPQHQIPASRYTGG